MRSGSLSGSGYHLDPRIPRQRAHLTPPLFQQFPKFRAGVSERARERANKGAEINFTPGTRKWAKWVDKGVSPTSGRPPKRECDHDRSAGGGRTSSGDSPGGRNGVRIGTTRNFRFSLPPPPAPAPVILHAHRRRPRSPPAPPPPQTASSRSPASFGAHVPLTAVNYTATGAKEREREREKEREGGNEGRGRGETVS